MQTITVKALMVPIEEYATVAVEANLYEAVLALEKAQNAFDPARHKHRAVLVLDSEKSVVGKLNIFDILMALEPKYGELEAAGVLSRSGHSPDLIASMLKDNLLWNEPMQFICNRAPGMNVRDFMSAPAGGAYIEQEATLNKAIHQMVISRFQSLLVTQGKQVVGVLRLSDVFAELCEAIKTCEF